MGDEIPQKYGRYRVIETLGRGAMGSVYLARDERLGREVAVKVVRTEALPAYAAEISTARFDNEARAIAALRHPHIVEIFDIGVEDGTPYLVMEVAVGTSLKDRLARGNPLSPGEVATVATQIASALQAAHQQTIIHRDVKPANILEVEPGLWKLADFGLARVPGSTVTLDGQFLGSPAYAAPEAIQMGDSTPATDIYGLGATMYEALVGHPPYGPDGLMTQGALAGDFPATPISNRRGDVPAALDGLILRAVSRDPDERPSALQMAEEVSLHAPPVRAASPVAALAPQHGGHRRAMTPMAPSGGFGRKHKIALGVGLFAALIVGVLLGSSGDDDSTMAVPGAIPWRQPAATPTRGPTPAEEPHDRHFVKEWNKILDKLDQGRYRDAEKRLRKLIDRYPESQSARELLRQVQQYEE